MKTNKICKSYAEIQALEAIKLKSFSALNLESIKQCLSEALEQNRSNGVFREYTQHDISHINGMLVLLDDIIPQKTKNLMTPTDWMMLVLSFYLHDFGMLVTEDEISNKDNNKDFFDYRNNNCDASLSIEDAFQNYIRDYHGERISNWLKTLNTISASSDVHIELLKKMIGSLSDDIRRDLAKICRSHSAIVR